MKNPTIDISPVIADNNTLRLNYIPGRTLSEQEFDLMQVYVDERCEDLLVGRTPGILEGLDLILPEKPDIEAIQINPGIGISFSGKAITNRLPIRFYWQDLRDQYIAEQTLLDELSDGVYFLALRRTILVFEESQRQDPNTRTELNPLRDTRLETLAQVTLQPVWFPEDLMTASRQRIAVSILQQMLESNSFGDYPDQIKLGMVKIKSQKPEWIDTIAGRFLAHENSVHHTLMDYWHAIVNSKKLFRLDGNAAEIKSTLNLNQSLDIDYLPATGKFPQELISHLAGREAANPLLWSRPVLNFKSDGLQIEILPIPDNAAQGILQNELSRGVIDLHSGSRDRFRILVAVNQNDYHPKLMDLPEIDMDLIKDYLAPKQAEAANAYQKWEEVYYELYGGLEEDIQVADVEKKKKTIENFSSIFLTNVTQKAFSKTTIDNKKLLRIPLVHTPKPLPIHESLRLLTRGKSGRPYSLITKITASVEDSEPIPEKEDASGKVHQRIDTRDDMEILEDLILKTNQLIDEVRDYLSLQRQQLDSMTVGFSSIAGGIPGDGAGLKLMRWSDKLVLQNKILTDSTGG